MEKSAAAFRTIGEVSRELGVPQHVLRYWETRFPQLRPITRAGSRRYYRPEDVRLARRIHLLLGAEGYTVRGVQKLLATAPAGDPANEAAAEFAPLALATPLVATLPIDELKAIRALLADALDNMIA